MTKLPKTVVDDHESTRTSDWEEFHGRFPYRFHKILSQVEKEELSHIISWLPCGTVFKVHNIKAFTTEVMPRIGRFTRYKSFLRQLSMYKFERTTFGPLKGTYRHPYFRKDHIGLCRAVLRGEIYDRPPATVLPTLVAKHSPTTSSLTASNETQDTTTTELQQQNPSESILLDMDLWERSSFEESKSSNNGVVSASCVSVGGSSSSMPTTSSWPDSEDEIATTTAQELPHDKNYHLQHNSYDRVKSPFLLESGAVLQNSQVVKEQGGPFVADSDLIPASWTNCSRQQPLSDDGRQSAHKTGLPIVMVSATGIKNSSTGRSGLAMDTYAGMTTSWDDCCASIISTQESSSSSSECNDISCSSSTTTTSSTEMAQKFNDLIEDQVMFYPSEIVDEIICTFRAASHLENF